MKYLTKRYTPIFQEKAYMRNIPIEGEDFFEKAIMIPMLFHIPSEKQLYQKTIQTLAKYERDPFLLKELSKVSPDKRDRLVKGMISQLREIIDYSATDSESNVSAIEYTVTPRFIESARNIENCIEALLNKDEGVGKVNYHLIIRLDGKRLPKRQIMDILIDQKVNSSEPLKIYDPNKQINAKEIISMIYSKEPPITDASEILLRRDMRNLVHELMSLDECLGIEKKHDEKKESRIIKPDLHILNPYWGPPKRGDA